MNQADTTLSPGKLRTLFDYNHVTGCLTWKESPSNWVKAGDKASTKTRRGQRVRIEGKYYLAHRVIWRMVTGDWPTGLLTHIDGNVCNNCWGNLRLVAGNQKRMARLSKTGTPGVFLTPEGKYLVRLTRTTPEHGRKSYYYGSFTFMDDAISALRHAELLWAGEASRRIFPTMLDIDPRPVVSANEQSALTAVDWLHSRNLGG